MGNLLHYLVENELYVVCELLRTDDFISYCKERDVEISRERLEQFERLGVLYPVLRMKRPKIKIKLEHVKNGTRHLGILGEGEEWHGETEETYSHFSFKREHAESWLNEGLLWEPSSRPFQEWKSFRDEDGEEHTESYYSIFQCYALYWITSSTAISLGLEFFDSPTEEEIRNFVHDISRIAKTEIQSLQAWRPESERLIALCQVISNRYFPLTQSDRRRTSVRISSDHHDWSWREYSRTWSAQKVLKDLGVRIEEVKEWQQFLSIQARACDPLASWYDLVSFISVEQKKRLKVKPLLAQSLYAMEEMLRLFYKDVTNEKLPAPDEGWGWDKNEFYGKGVIENNLLFLEFVTNRFHLNPRPKLILIVEGDGEEQEFPRLAAEGFGSSFSRLGVEVYNLRGVDNAANDNLDKYSALKKLIDYHHHHQTLVFAVLDDEGSARRVRDEVTRARSRHNPKRTVMPKEHFHLWNDSIEFDNFSYDEIARVMTQLSEDQYTFTIEEIGRCHESKKAKERDSLKTLFDEKVYAHFSKVKLLKIPDSIGFSGKTLSLSCFT